MIDFTVLNSDLNAHFQEGVVQRFCKICVAVRRYIQPAYQKGKLDI